MDEDDMATLSYLLAVTGAFLALIPDDDLVKRPDYFVRQRVNWNSHLTSMIREKSFQRYYRMSYESFEKLHHMLLVNLVSDEQQSARRSMGEGAISTRIKLHCFLRYVAGSNIDDIRIIAGISKPSFYRCVYIVANAINSCEDLKYSFPINDQLKLRRIAKEFANRSTDSVMKGCVGAVDGYLLLTACPSAKEVDNVNHYFSGHYQHYGLNIQAVVDAQCRFMEVCVAAPGAANDCHAISQAKLLVKFESLPLGMFVVGDNAYIPSEHLLIPFSGADKKEKKFDSFNFYLSQLRIKVEQAFGLLTSKFQILKRPSTLQLKYLKGVFLAVTRIHNFCINERTLPDDNEPEVMYTLRGTQMLYVPSDVTHTVALSRVIPFFVNILLI